MKEEVLNLIKESYKKSLNRREKDKEIWNRLNELEQNEFVQEYLKLRSTVSNIDPNKKYLSNDEILELSYRENTGYIDETNKIYVCLDSIFLTHIYGIEYKYNRYINIENQFDTHLIPLEDCNKFESSHQVIYPTNLSRKSYHEIQMDFIKTCIHDGQEQACKKILSKKY